MKLLNGTRPSFILWFTPEHVLVSHVVITWETKVYNGQRDSKCVCVCVCVCVQGGLEDLH